MPAAVFSFQNAPEYVRLSNFRLRYKLIWEGTSTRSDWGSVHTGRQGYLGAILIAYRTRNIVLNQALLYLIRSDESAQRTIVEDGIGRSRFLLFLFLAD